MVVRDQTGCSVHDPNSIPAPPLFDVKPDLVQEVPPEQQWQHSARGALSRLVNMQVHFSDEVGILASGGARLPATITRTAEGFHVTCRVDTSRNASFGVDHMTSLVSRFESGDYMWFWR